MLRLLWYPAYEGPGDRTGDGDGDGDGERKREDKREGEAEDGSMSERGADLRAGAHTDYGSLTLLFQQDDQPGLEIQTSTSSSSSSSSSSISSTGAWASVPVRPPGSEHDPTPPLVLNVGDLLQHWTNGLLKSTVHRVVSSSSAGARCRERYSLAYFCHPANETLLAAIPSAVVAEAGRKEGGGKGTLGERGRVPITAREHLLARLAATYRHEK